MLHHIGPEGPWSELYYRTKYEGGYRQTEAQRQEFQTEVFLAYFRQLNDGVELFVPGVGEVAEADLIGHLSQYLIDGRLRIKWLDFDGEAQVAVSGGDERRFVEAVLPQDLFDLIAPDCRYYRQMTNSPVAELVEWARERLGVMLGLEDGFSPVSILTPEQRQIVWGEVRRVIGEIAKKGYYLWKLDRYRDGLSI